MVQRLRVVGARRQLCSGKVMCVEIDCRSEGTKIANARNAAESDREWFIMVRIAGRAGEKERRLR